MSKDSLASPPRLSRGVSSESTGSDPRRSPRPGIMLSSDNPSWWVEEASIVPAASVERCQNLYYGNYFNNTSHSDVGRTMIVTAISCHAKGEDYLSNSVEDKNLGTLDKLTKAGLLTVIAEGDKNLVKPTEELINRINDLGRQAAFQRG